MTEAELKKLQWASRRGMLELDVVLLPYLAEYGASMSADEAQKYSAFLEEADPDLYSWIMGYAPVKPEFQAVVENIRSYVDAQLDSAQAKPH